MKKTRKAKEKEKRKERGKMKKGGKEWKKKRLTGMVSLLQK